MSDQDGSHAELEQALLALDDRAMVLEELDGFIAGLLVCPEPIPPGEWFARVVGLSKSARSPFADLDHANRVLGLVMTYYDEVIATLQREPERYRPRYPFEKDEVIWELWLEGFEAAISLRRGVLESYVALGGDANLAATNMMVAIGATRDGNPESQDYAKLSARAPEMLRDCVVTLVRHRRQAVIPSGEFATQPNPFAGARKVGRNDPCPCGSGQKYKRCCGAN